jgi:hypothetical protein
VGKKSGFSRSANQVIQNRTIDATKFNLVYLCLDFALANHMVGQECKGLAAPLRQLVPALQMVVDGAQAGVHDRSDADQLRLGEVAADGGIATAESEILKMAQNRM